MMRFLIECTYVFDHPNDNSGIQRVVRNVIHSLPCLETKETCIPVIFKREKVFQVKKLAPVKLEGWMSRLRTWAVQHRARYWHSHSVRIRKHPFDHSRTLRRLIYLLYRIFSIGHIIPLALVVAASRLWIDKKRVAPLAVAPGDVLIMLDSSWQSNIQSTAQKLKSQGVRLVGVVYDLIPLTHPQFCDQHLVKIFESWFAWVVRQADGFMCISKTTAEQVRRFDRALPGSPSNANRWYDYFYLGAGLDKMSADARISPRVRRVFHSGRPVYLMVSTIEPRKNHDYLLDAFELLWDKGVQVALCFVGKVGWKCDALIRRIETHPQSGRRLFMLNGLSDSELAFCYQASKALVFPSYVEGFGLPIIEALGHGLPVLVSDIPVFREIGVDYAIYFDLADPSSLCREVENFEALDPIVQRARLKSWQWLTWRDATIQLLDRTRFNLDNTRVCQQGPS